MPRIIIKEPDQKPQPYRLKINRIVTKIGRAKDNDILITDGSSSTYHCKIKRVEGGFILVDSDSTNGIKSKGTRYSIIDLKDGETVQIGDDIDLKFSLSEEEIEELSSEDFESQQKACFPKSKKPKKEELQDSDDDEELDDEEEEEEKPTPKKKSPKKTKSKKQRELDEDEDDLDHDEDESDENEDDLDEDQDTRSKSKKKSRRSKPSSSKDKNKDSDRKRDERPRRQQQEKSNSSLSFVIFIILAVLCFIAGLAIRHYLDHEMFIFTK